MGRASQVDRESLRNCRQVMGRQGQGGEMAGGDGGASEEAGICGASLASALYLQREAPFPLEVLKMVGMFPVRGFGTG